ncbi:hypothetical protein F4824DRAFT_493879 [Ustulina deusta]|nr:hypothetical protein F4823DRAFT_383233 [Ustulina deusta]KAI3343625.1 hypothetical protein F4824DRAFT_493879 [Ustulina deusta]
MAEEYAEEIIEEQPPNPAGDVEMGEGAEGDERIVLPFAEGGESEPRTTFISYLTSPVVTLIVGSAESETILTAHQALLVQSPFFADACAAFADDGSPRHIELVSEEIDAVGCFLEYLYTGDYFPKKVPGQRSLEPDPSLPAIDETGEQLLKHARVYTIAERFGVDKLRSLASSKIHCVNSTAKGELTYARYIYQYTKTDDTTVRAPVANFWATRSHTLRSEAEDEFRALCLEFPQFGYDILTRVLDEKLKRERNEKMTPGAGSARKRARHSNI